MDVEREGEEDLMELGSTGFLTQEEGPRGKMIFDARNGFKQLSHLEMLWTVRHRWTTEKRIAFNWCKHWAQLLFRQPRSYQLCCLYGRE